MPAAGRSSYHHGELRIALVAAADAIIRESGIEGFSLRETARRAGVSPGAPAHHFDGVVGLLTAVAILGYDELARRLAQVEPTGATARDLRAYTTAYVLYASEHPGRFRLMSRDDLVDRTQPGFIEASRGAMTGFSRAAAAYYGAPPPLRSTGQVHPGVLSVIATAYGMAHMTIDDRWSFILQTDSRTNFVTNLLPGILMAQWPD